MFSRTVDVLVTDPRGLAVDRGLLATSELLGARRFGSQRAQTEYLAVRTWLRQILASYLDCPPNEIALGDNGGCRVQRPATDLSFSFAHSAEIALVAVAFRRSIGVAVEHMDEKALVPVSLDHFTRHEQERIARSHDPVRTHRKLLVRKTALAQAMDTADSVGELDVSGLSPVAAAGLEITDLYLADDVVAAAALPPLSTISLILDQSVATGGDVVSLQQPDAAAV